MVNSLSLARVRHALLSTLLIVVAAAPVAAQDATQPAVDVDAQRNTPKPAASARWFDTLDFFVGPDGSKQPQDLGINANMGLRMSANWGAPIAKRAGVGFQIGTGVNLSDAAVHVLDQIEGTSRRTQLYVTFGAFQRMSKVSWGLAYDMLRQDYYDTFTVGQVRGEVGFKVKPQFELGTWFTKRAQSADGVMAGTPMRLEPISQINAFFRQTWPTGAQTSVWAGVAGGHANIVWLLPDSSQSDPVFVYGADLHFALNERFALTGAANFVTPTATGTVDAFLGVVFYPGKGAASARSRAFAPLSAVANNPSFAVNLKR